MKGRRGFRYRLEREDLIAYRKLTAEEKLNWLEEIVTFTEMILTPKEKKVLDYFRDEEGGMSGGSVSPDGRDDATEP